MNKLQPKSKENVSKSLQTDKDFISKKNLILGTLIATFIALTPIIFNLYKSVPDVQIWDTFLFKLNSRYYGSATVLAWTLMIKVSPLLLFIVWFFTCRHWWYHAIIIPIGMHIYQIITILNDDLKFVDQHELIYLLPVMAVIIPSIYLIRAKIFNTINDVNKTTQQLEDDLKLGPRSLKNLINNYF